MIYTVYTDIPLFFRYHIPITLSVPIPIFQLEAKSDIMQKNKDRLQTFLQARFFFLSLVHRVKPKKKQKKLKKMIKQETESLLLHTENSCMNHEHI